MKFNILKAGFFKNYKCSNAG